MFRDLLASEFQPYGVLSAEQLTALEEHYRLLVRWNQRMNLTRIEDEETAVRLHYCESLFLGAWLPPGPLSVADVGSGAGFPGIPIAIIRPDLFVCLLESHQRKAAFLREATSHLSNTRVVPMRAEEVKERFDWVVSRAVAPQEVIAARLAPNHALLLGYPDAVAEVVKLPWGKQRVLSVSRETHQEKMFHVKPQCDTI